MTTSTAARALRSPVLGRLGKISYGLYLIHVGVFHFERTFLTPVLAYHLGLRGLLLTGAEITCELLLLWPRPCWSWKYLEQPVLKLRRWFKA